MIKHLARFTTTLSLSLSLSAFAAPNLGPNAAPAPQLKRGIDAALRLNNACKATPVRASSEKTPAFLELPCPGACRVGASCMCGSKGQTT
jgi:hypothetical protein